MPANPSSGSAAIKLQKSDFQASNKSYVAIFSIRLFFEKVEGGHPTAFQRVSSEVRFPNLLHRSEWVDKTRRSKKCIFQPVHLDIQPIRGRGQSGDEVKDTASKSTFDTPPHAYN